MRHSLFDGCFENLTAIYKELVEAKKKPTASKNVLCL